MRAKLLCLCLLLSAAPPLTHAGAVASTPLHARADRPLWPGAQFTEADRRRAALRGLAFIYRTARDPANFDEYGSDYLWCFYTLSAALREAALRRAARRYGVELAREWRRRHRALPPGAEASTIADFAFGSDAADSLGLRDPRLKRQLRRAAREWSARDYLEFDPLAEPPPSDVPAECDNCRAHNPRGAQTCRACRRTLTMRSRYDVWYDALITTYVGERYGVRLGARYSDVLRWLPRLRPYPVAASGGVEFYDAVYAVTHVVYTLNDYGLYRLAPRLLPREFEFLKANLREAVRRDDPDMLGEFMDSLRAFGLETDDPLMREGVDYLLARQNADGSWGDVRERDIYLRYHPTWNAVAALGEYAWRGERLSFPHLKPLLERWAQAAEGQE